jgi:hypothetical protein
MAKVFALNRFDDLALGFCETHISMQSFLISSQYPLLTSDLRSWHLTGSQAAAGPQYRLTQLVHRVLHLHRVSVGVFMLWPPLSPALQVDFSSSSCAFLPYLGCPELEPTPAACRPSVPGFLSQRYTAGFRLPRTLSKRLDRRLANHPYGFLVARSLFHAELG